MKDIRNSPGDYSGLILSLSSDENTFLHKNKQSDMQPKALRT